MVDTCIESREASTVCLLQMPSPLSGPCADSLGPLCHFPRLRGDELLSLEDGQAGTPTPVGQGPTFSMRPGDGWVRAPRGLARRVLVSVSLLRFRLCYSLSLGEPQLQFRCSPLFKRDSPHLLGKMKSRGGVKSVSWQVEGRLVALGVSPEPSTMQPQCGLSPCPEGAQETAGHLELAPTTPLAGTYAAPAAGPGQKPRTPWWVLMPGSLRAHRLQFLLLLWWWWAHHCAHPDVRPAPWPAPSGHGGASVRHLDSQSWLRP